MLCSGPLLARWNLMRSLLDDLRQAFRALRKNPVLTAVALLSLGIGIGANTAIFSIMDRLLLRSLPIRDPGQLVLVTTPGDLAGSLTAYYWYDESMVLSWPKYRMLREQSSSVLDGLLARFGLEVNIASRGVTQNARGELVSGNYFDVLGVHPALGRLLTDDDTRALGGNPVVVLSHAYWTRAFGGDRSVLNQAIVVNGQQFTIVGVSQAGFRSVGSGESPAVFLPVTMQQKVMTWDHIEDVHAYWLNVVGRLKPGVSRTQAQSALNVAWRNIITSDVTQLPPTVGEHYRNAYLKKQLVLQPGAAGFSSLRDRFENPLYLLLGMAGLLLLIACGNIANLLLARAVSRQKEIAIRLSLGASRLRLIRHLLCESVLLSLAGALAGVLLAPWVGSLVLRLVPSVTPIAGISADPDGRILAFAFVLALFTSVLFGTFPALRASRPELAPALREQTSSLSSGSHARFRKSLVVAQIAFSVVLLASAGLFARSLYNLQTVNPGFRTNQLLSFRIDPSLNGYDHERARRLFQEIGQALRSVPGVTGSSMAREPLLSDSISMDGYFIEGYHPQDKESITLSENRIGPGFFSVMGIALVAGREFAEGDSKGGPPVAIINETLARKYFDKQNPIGLHLTLDDDRTIPKLGPIEIVGVVKDSKYNNLREKPQQFVYFPSAQDRKADAMSFYLRTALPPRSLGSSLQTMLQHFDRNLPITGPKLMTDDIMESVYIDRLVATLSTAFAAIATALAAMGLYGVIAWAVTRRKREIGIRMALGAQPGSVLNMMLREVLWLGAIGAAIAVPLWLAIGRYVQSQIYGITSRDPVSIGAAILLLSLVAAAAGSIPAFRAARIDPVSAIRYE